MRDGLTVAQIYQTLTSRLTTDKTALSGYLDDTQMDVHLIDETDLLSVENLLDTEFSVTKTNDDGEQETEKKKLSEYATISRGKGVASIQRENGTRTMSVTCDMEDGYNSTLVGRKVQEKLDSYEVPKGYTVEMAGSTTDVNNMISQMMQMMLLGFVLIYHGCTVPESVVPVYRYLYGAAGLYRRFSWPAACRRASDADQSVRFSCADGYCRK